MGQMTDSTQTPTQGRRERLAAGAREVIHRHGVEATTIADIAEAARVPVGNVYYYFKTKHELVEAAIDSRARDVRSLLDSLDLHRTPQARLEGAGPGADGPARAGGAIRVPAREPVLGARQAHRRPRSHVRATAGAAGPMGRAAVRADRSARRPRSSRRPARCVSGCRPARQHVSRP